MSRAGIDRTTGRLLEGWDHCVQSIAVILTTQVGTRVMRRAFGADVHELQDRNPDPVTVMTVYAAVAEALRRWEPGFRLTRIGLDRTGADGVAVFTLSGTYYPDGHRGDYSRSEERDAGISADGLQFWRAA